MTRQELEASPEGASGRVTFVHEWFASVGGSENVVVEMLSAFPGSELYCLWKSEGVDVPNAGKVFESWLANSPLRGKKVLALPFMPLSWRSSVVQKMASDLVVVSSHLFAHHVKVPAGARKLVYVHTPARYIWEPELDVRGRSIFARGASLILRPLDKMRSREAHSIAANSEYVRKRIRRAWDRDSIVIYPPVDVELIRETADWRSALQEWEKRILDALPDVFILGASRMIPYKRLDKVIEAGELTGLPVVIAGSGPSEPELRSIASRASVPVYFVMSPSDALLRSLYQKAQVYVFPPVEDFGIMPVESIAAGTPVAANSEGGASESVVEGVSGALFDLDDSNSLREAVLRAAALKNHDIAQHAERFSRARFRQELQTWCQYDRRKSYVGPAESAPSQVKRGRTSSC